MKKLILPIVLTFIFLVLLANLFTPQVFADSEFTCKDSFGKVDPNLWDEGTYGDQWIKLVVEKGGLEKKDGDFCKLNRLNFGYGFDKGPDSEYTVKISYFFDPLKHLHDDQEAKGFITTSSDDTSYSGYTAIGNWIEGAEEGGNKYESRSLNYNKTVTLFGKCIIAFSFIDHYELYPMGASDETEFKIGRASKVKNSVMPSFDAIKQSSELQSFCGSSSEGSSSGGIFDTVKNIFNKSKTQEKTPQQPPVEQISKQEDNPSGGMKSPVQDLNNWIIDTFGIYEPAVSVISDQHSQEIAQAEKENGERKLDNKLNDEALWQFGADPKDLLERKPKLPEIDIEHLKEQQGQSDSPFRLDLLNGQAQIKYPGESKWRDIRPGDKIPPGSTIFTGMDATTVLSIRDKGVIQILSFTEVTITEEGLADPTKTTTDIDLRAGEVELNVPGGAYTGFDYTLKVGSEYTTTGVRGTHFWVKHDDKKKTDTIGVYEGEVEVKTRDGKTSIVTPVGDKPGVVVVAQKLSVAKLSVAAFVAVALIGGAVFILRKRFSLKSFKKKK